MASKTEEFDRLVKQADKAVHRMGGLLLLLLAVERHGLAMVEWDSTKSQFYIDGTSVSFNTIQLQLGVLESKLANTIAEYNKELYQHKITTDEWKKKMQALVENSHVLMGALALGGIEVAANNPVVVRKISGDIEALQRWAASLKVKKLPSLAMLLNRGRAYIRSSYITYQVLNQRAHIALGYTEAKRILTAAEHCRTDRHGHAGCLETAARGWLDIREMPPIGSLVCGQFCKCHLIYR